MNASVHPVPPRKAERAEYSDGGTRALVERARRAQQRWGGISVAQRIGLLRQFRGLLVEETATLLNPLQQTRAVSMAEVLVSEIVPLADACRFLEEEAEQILAPFVPQGRRPLWLAGTKLNLRREPLGVVLIIAPSNYPLFIPGVQLLQAIAAGNAVLVKPGRGTGEVMRTLRDVLVRSGMDRDLATVLDDNDELGVRRVIAEGADKVVLTGSARTGGAIAEAAAQSFTPCTMELSGCDAAFVLAGADAALAAKALVFGMRLNRSRTCMRPHRLFVQENLRDTLLRHLADEINHSNPDIEPYQPTLAWNRMLADALSGGAKVILGDPENPLGAPMVLEGVDPGSELGQTDAFLPLLILYSFAEVEQGLRTYDQCTYALGVSIFGEHAEAEKLARRINAGVVVINDVIIPTADPRLPFSGRKRSGFGVTRGAEGLLEMTRVKGVSTRQSNYRHLDPLHPEDIEKDTEFFLAYLQMAHGAGLKRRLRGVVSLIRAGMNRARSRNLRSGGARS